MHYRPSSFFPWTVLTCKIPTDFTDIRIKIELIQDKIQNENEIRESCLWSFCVFIGCRGQMSSLLSQSSLCLCIKLASARDFVRDAFDFVNKMLFWDKWSPICHAMLGYALYFILRFIQISKIYLHL